MHNAGLQCKLNHKIGKYVAAALIKLTSLGLLHRICCSKLAQLAPLRILRFKLRISQEQLKGKLPLTVARRPLRRRLSYVTDAGSATRSTIASRWPVQRPV